MLVIQKAEQSKKLFCQQWIQHMNKEKKGIFHDLKGLNLLSSLQRAEKWKEIQKLMMPLKEELLIYLMIILNVYLMYVLLTTNNFHCKLIRTNLPANKSTCCALRNQLISQKIRIGLLIFTGFSDVNCFIKKQRCIWNF